MSAKVKADATTTAGSSDGSKLRGSSWS